MFGIALLFFLLKLRCVVVWVLFSSGMLYSGTVYLLCVMGEGGWVSRPSYPEGCSVWFELASLCSPCVFFEAIRVGTRLTEMILSSANMTVRYIHKGKYLFDCNSRDMRDCFCGTYTHTLSPFSLKTNTSLRLCRCRMENCTTVGTRA